MKTTIRILQTTIAALAVCFAVVDARAGARTFVSGTGNDGGNNTCSFTNPCRTFAQALTVTPAGGEIVVLDSAGYGPMMITQSVSVTNPGGVEAGVSSVTNTDAITISAGASDVVTLRGLSVDGQGAGRNGIVLNSAGNLEILDCVVRNFANTGILLQSSSSNEKIFIQNTRVLDNVNAAGIELLGVGSAGVPFLNLDHVTVENNNYGLYITTPNSGQQIFTTITNSNFSQNGPPSGTPPSAGIAIVSTNGIFSTWVSGSSINSNFGYGVELNSGGAFIFLSHNTIEDNETGVNIISGSGYTDGTNNIGDNSLSPVVGTLTSSPSR